MSLTGSFIEVVVRSAVLNLTTWAQYVALAAGHEITTSVACWLGVLYFALGLENTENLLP